jgi:hypothetical protein
MPSVATIVRAVNSDTLTNRVAWRSVAGSRRSMQCGIGAPRQIVHHHDGRAVERTGDQVGLMVDDPAADPPSHVARRSVEYPT